MANSATAAPSLFDHAEARLLAEASLRSISLSTSKTRGEEFFRALVRDLAKALDVFYVIAGELIVEAGEEKARTLAVWAGSDFLPNITYGLDNTPCSNVACQTMCFHPCDIQKEYPLDHLLVEMKAESYIGMPMVGSEGRTLGILVALDTRPMDENKRLLALSLLSIFSSRCAAELEHRQRESELERLVEQRTRALEEAQEKLVEREKLAALGGLVAGMAHEINTPIGVALTASSGIGDYAQAFDDVLGGEKVSRLRLRELAAAMNQGAQLVQRNLERAADLIGNFKKLAADQAVDDLVELSLANYLGQLVAAHSPEIRKRQARVRVDIASELRVRLPAGMLAQIVSNLLMNALIHGLEGRPDGTVTIAARADGSDLRLMVSDDGAGVSAEALPHLLEPFYTTKRGKGGTGLGLHIVFTLVQRLGGTLDLSSPPGQGLGIAIHLPGCVI